MTKIVSIFLLLSLVCSISASALPHLLSDMEQWTIEMEIEEEKNENKIELEDDVDEYWTNSVQFNSQKALNISLEIFTPHEWTEFEDRLVSPPPEK